MLQAGMKAPEFTLMNQDGNPVSLSDFLGKRIVLYFYPRDNTPGCTRQACAFAGAYEGLDKGYRMKVKLFLAVPSLYLALYHLVKRALQSLQYCS